MKRRVLGILVVAAVVGAGAIGAVRLWPRPAPTPPKPEAPATASGTVKFLMEQQWAIRMKLAKAEPTILARQITATGRIVPAAGRQAIVAPPVAGLITSPALPRVGQAVARGETVATLRHVPTAAESAQIETSRIEQVRLVVERRRAIEAVAATEARLDQARRELDRSQQLYEYRAIAQRQLEAAEIDVRVAQAAHATAVAQRDALHGVEARSSADGPTAYTITAPIAGTVVRVTKSPGEQVGAGEAILEIVALDTVWVEVPIFERDLPRLAGSDRVVFTTASLPSVELSGRLVNRGAVIDPRTRAATLLFEIANPEGRLPVGLMVNARVDASERAQALLVPRQAVLEADGKRFVYVLRSGEDFERREITVGDEHGAQIAVEQGLKAGERLVTQGAWQLRQQELRPTGAGAHTHE